MRSYSLIDFTSPPQLYTDWDWVVRFKEHVRRNLVRFVPTIPSECEIDLFASGHAHNPGLVPLLGLYEPEGVDLSSHEVLTVIDNVRSRCADLSGEEVNAIVRNTEAPTWEELKRMHSWPIRLRRVDSSNWQACAELQVSEDQRTFLPSNLHSIAASQFFLDNVSRAIDVGGQIVGFALYGIELGPGRLKLFRFMIDANQQRRGYGRAAMQSLLNEMSDRWHPSEIFVSYQDDNAVARRLYERFGFREIERVGRKVTAMLVVDASYTKGT